MSDGNGNGQGDTGADGGESTSFVDGFASEELKGNETFKSFENLDAFGQSHIDLTKAHDELKSEHDELKGSLPVVPESVDDYKVELPEDLPVDEAEMGAFKEFAFENKFTADQYSKLVLLDAARQQAQIKEINDAKDAALDAIKTEHGDNYEAELQKVQKILNVAFEGDDAFKDAKIEEYPHLFKGLSRLGKLISEDSLQAGGNNNAGQEGEEDPAKKLFGDMKGLPKT